MSVTLDPDRDGPSATVALVVAAGRGTRFGGDLPKQYAPLAGKTVLRHALERFCAHAGIDAVRAVIHPDDVEAYHAASAGLNLLAPVFGGTSRQESVRLGLESLHDLQPRHVLIHDGARPLVDHTIVDGVLDALAEAPAALPVLPVTDTLKRGAEGMVVRNMPRAGLFRAQTPQGFAFAAILDAHRRFAGADDITDDAMLAERAALPVRMTAGSERNLKVTTMEDLARAEALQATARVPCVGTGFDVHRCVEGNGVHLCGVFIDAPFRLLGHSDADVGLHALTDALFGALAEGDIGSHFPPSDMQWQGADSGIFLEAALERVRARDGALVHVDVTLICERPKIGPHRDAMRARLGALLGLPVSRVSVKATTSERLGFTGRGEGIAAQAVATVLLPA